MKKIDIVFSTENSAFDDNAQEEAARILENCAARIRRGGSGANILDSNGNTIGKMTIHE